MPVLGPESLQCLVQTKVESARLQATGSIQEECPASTKQDNGMVDCVREEDHVKPIPSSYNLPLEGLDRATTDRLADRQRLSRKQRNNIIQTIYDDIIMNYNNM